MNTTNYPLAVMHHYEIGIEKLGRLPAPGGARRHREDQGHRGRLEEPAARCCPMARSCCRRSSRRCSRRRSSFPRSACARAFCIRCCAEDEQRADPLISASEELALLRARSVTHAHELVDWTAQTLRSLRHRRDRGRGALPPRGLPARRHRLARASRISRHAVAQHHRACLLHRRRPSRPALHRAGQRSSATRASSTTRIAPEL